MIFEEWSKIKMFRCVTDPMVGPKPRQAFMLPDLPGWEAYLHAPSGTIHVQTDKGRRHVIGMGNWSSIELIQDDEQKPATIQAAAQIPQYRRGKQKDTSNGSV